MVFFQKSGTSTDSSTHQQHLLPYLDTAAFHARLPCVRWLNRSYWFNHTLSCTELGRDGTETLHQVAEKSEAVAVGQGCLQHIW